MTMDNDRISTSFGRYLQAIRIDKGLSLDTVSKETRIRLETLLQIEEEDFKKLPAEVFVKGFLLDRPDLEYWLLDQYRKLWI